MLWDRFLFVITRKHKPYRNTILIVYGTGGQKQLEETISQAVAYNIHNQFTSAIICNWHEEVLDRRVKWISSYVPTFKPRQMMEGAPDGLLGNLELAEETQSEWQEQQKKWMAGAAWQTTHLGGNLGMVVHFLSSGGGHLIPSQEGVRESHGTFK